MRVFKEITSKANNVEEVASNSKPGGDKGSRKGKKNMPTTRIQEDNSTIAESMDGLSQKDSSESEYSYASKSNCSGTLGESTFDEDDFSSDYDSSDDEASDGSGLSYCSSESTDDMSSVRSSANERFLRHVKRRTKREETEYNTYTEKRLRAIHLVACRHLRVSSPLFNLFYMRY